MALANFHELPPSFDAADEGVITAPERETLPWHYAGRGRAALVALGLVGSALFFAPWVDMTMPDIVELSAFDLARHRLGWLWGAFVGWFVLVPTVASRRTIAQLRGARVAAAFLSAVPTVSVAVLLAFPPHGRRGVPVSYTWTWAFWATLALSAVAIACAVRLGGGAPATPRPARARVAPETSRGQQLH